MICGSSSMLLRRRKRPTRVMRGSLSAVCQGPMLPPHSTTMLRNLNMPNSRPCLGQRAVWRNSTGRPSVQQYSQRGKRHEHRCSGCASATSAPCDIHQALHDDCVPRTVTAMAAPACLTRCALRRRCTVSTCCCALRSQLTVRCSAAWRKALQRPALERQRPPDRLPVKGARQDDRI
jgi:hypothetical protein